MDSTLPPAHTDVGPELSLAKLLFQLSSTTPQLKKQRTDELMKVISEKSAYSGNTNPPCIAFRGCPSITIARLASQSDLYFLCVAGMAPFYSYCCEKFGWTVDDLKLQQMTATCDAALAKANEKCARTNRQYFIFGIFGAIDASFFVF